MHTVQVHCVVNNAGLAIPSMPDDPAEKVAAFRKFLAVNLEGGSLMLLDILVARLVCAINTKDALVEKQRELPTASGTPCACAEEHFTSKGRG